MAEDRPAKLHRLSGPNKWEALTETLQSTGGAIIENFIAPLPLQALNQQIDSYLADHVDAGAAVTGSTTYDRFLGHQTIRLHGLLDKLPLTQVCIGHTQLLAWVHSALHDTADSVLLNAAELIQINPGEPAQLLHRDTDSWPMPRGEHPTIVNAIIALDDFTTKNGATALAPGSWAWRDRHKPTSVDLTQAVMSKGDALLFRGDLVHGGGANHSTTPRRALSISFCAGWLRPVENSHLNLPLATILSQPPHIQALLGFAAHDGTRLGAGMIGLFENGDPMRYLEAQASSAT